MIELYGTKENLDIAEYVYYFLLNKGKLLWLSYKDESALSNDKLKLSFLQGLYNGFYTKLEKQHIKLTQEKALIWLGDRKLDAFFRQRNPRVRKVSHVTHHDHHARAAGQKVGKKLDVHPGLSHFHANKIRAAKAQLTAGNKD